MCVCGGGGGGAAAAGNGGMNPEIGLWMREAVGKSGGVLS